MRDVRNGITLCYWIDSATYEWLSGWHWRHLEGSASDSGHAHIVHSRRRQRAWWYSHIAECLAVGYVYWPWHLQALLSSVISVPCHTCIAYSGLRPSVLHRLPIHSRRRSCQSFCFHLPTTGNVVSHVPTTLETANNALTTQQVTGINLVSHAVITLWPLNK